MHAHWDQVSETEWVFTIQADRFLRNMVRAIVGTLVEVGRGKLSVEGFRKVIEEKEPLQCRYIRTGTCTLPGRYRLSG